MSHLTDNEINTLENRIFRYECERDRWRDFREKVENFMTMRDTFGNNTPEEVKEIKRFLEEIKYY